MTSNAAPKLGARRPSAATFYYGNATKRMYRCSKWNPGEPLYREPILHPATYFNAEEARENLIVALQNFTGDVVVSISSKAVEWEPDIYPGEWETD